MSQGLPAVSRAVLLAVIGLTGCGGPTGLILEVRSDFAVPAELDRLAIRIWSGTDHIDVIKNLGNQPDAVSFPVRLGLQPGRERRGKISVEVVGRRAGADVIRRDARVAFVPDELMLLVLELGRRCQHAVCPDGATCDPSAGCVPTDAVMLMPVSQ